jgi:general secretion pathway protein G
LELRIPSGNASESRPHSEPGPKGAPSGSGFASNQARLSTERVARRRGFTFVELMVVLTITVILISMAIPIYQRSILRAKESVLHNNLFTLRTVIDNYTYDKQKAPQTLDSLVSDGYLREIPLDPITGSNQTWRTIMEDASQSVNQSEPGIFDVRSGSDAVGLNGIPYSNW